MTATGRAPGVDALLRAGGLAPPGARPAEPVDPLTARRYRHPALGDAPVVRLVAAPLGRAEDLALQAVGFAPAGESAPVALVRRRALGFPGWVLVNSPEHADLALAVAEEMEVAAALARSRPGAAREAYETIARRLARTVPHFLPTYFEQAGRGFMDAGNGSQAGVMFGKARDAERVYALEVDEERRLAAHLEFAVAGALTARSLGAYADELARSADPFAAYATFRRLCVERTRAGVPPWADMATRLRRLGAAAGVEEEDGDRDLLADLLEAPAVARAPLGFWKAYRRALLDMAAGSAAVRGRLLNLHPTGAGVREWWLGLLDTTGALDGLTRPAGDVFPSAAPRGGPARWLSRTLAQEGERHDALFALLPRMAKRLRSDGTPVRVAGPVAWQIDLDLLDLALELRLPVEPPRPGVVPPLQRWLARPADRRRDLDHLARDPTWGPVLLQALDSHLRGSPAAALLEGGHLRRGLIAWLDRVADRIEGGGLPDLTDEAGRLGRVLDPGVLGTNPLARDRILRATAASALARTLRGGCLDELGWPALEQARAKLGPVVAASGSWPNVVVTDGVRAIVAGPDAVLLEHDLRTPPGIDPRRHSFLTAGGQLLVCWWDPGGGRRAYWSGRPAEVFDPGAFPTNAWSSPLALSLELADGSRTAGGRALRPGDTGGMEPRHVIGDGARLWTLAGGRYRALDPASGRLGEASLPDFLAAGDEAGALVPESSWLAPAPPEREDGGPLGASGGLTGVRVRRTSDGRYDVEGADGRRLTARMSAAPSALVAFPGDAGAPRPVTLGWQRIELWEPSGRFRLFQAAMWQAGPDLAKATALVLPPTYWVNLRPRDEAGSAALRALTDEVAAGLVAAPDREEAVARLLPGITHPGLRRAVAAQAEVAAGLQRTIDGLLAGLVREDETPDGPTDAALEAALGGLATRRSLRGAAVSRTSTVRQLALVDRFMDTGELPERFLAAPVPWALLAGRMAAAGYRAVSPAVPAAEREALAGLLERWAETAMARHPERFRIAEVVEDAASTLSPGCWVRRRGGRRWFISERRTAYREPNRRLVLELAAKDGFDVPPDMRLEWERVGTGAWERPDRLRRLAALVRERGPVPWVPERVDELARWTGLSRAEAALLLAGLPLIATWQRSFLPADVRKLLGLKVAEAAAARDRLNALPVQWRIELVAAAMPDDPAALWKPYAAEDPDGPPARIARAWLRTFGRRTAVDEATVAALRSAVSLARPVDEALAPFVDPAASTRLNGDAAWVVGPGGSLEPAPGMREAPFDGGALRDVALVVPWLFASRPVGDPLRTAVPDVVERARLRLANPDLVVAAGWAGEGLSGQRLLDLVRGPRYRQPGGRELPDSRDTGAFVLVGTARSPMARAFVRPALLDAAADALLPMLGEEVRAICRRVRFLAGDEAAALAERVRQTPVPDGGWEANPAVSAPAVLEEAAAALGLSPDAAALYLQLLAAPDPTVRAVRQWNAWAGAAMDEAAAELVAAGLAVRARRPRAGRDVFLPGAWEELKAPDLPTEAWRLRLYGGRPLGRLLAPRPLHVLFDEAWRLVRAGEGPAFEEIAR